MQTTDMHIIETNVRRFGGRRTASNDKNTVIRYRFPFEGKALRFRDEMITLNIRTLVQPLNTLVQPLNPTDMVIDLR